MKPHRILKNFKGSQNGHDHHEFEAGTVAHLSKDLAAIVVKEGWAEPHDGDSSVSEAIRRAAPAITEQAHAGVIAALERETKIVGPEETKPFDITKLTKKQLVEFAGTNLGLVLDEGTKKEDLLATINSHTSAPASDADAE